MKPASVHQGVHDLVQPIITGLGYELVDVEYTKEGKNWVLRIYIDSPQGIGLADCERVSKGIAPALDAADPIPHSYTMEVSSPGLERPLKCEADYQRCTGLMVAVNTYTAISGGKTHTGILQGLENGEVLIESQGKMLRIPLKLIAASHLAVQF